MLDSFLAKCNNLNVVLFTTTVLLLGGIIEMVKSPVFPTKTRVMCAVFLRYCFASNCITIG